MAPLPVSVNIFSFGLLLIWQSDSSALFITSGFYYIKFFMFSRNKGKYSATMCLSQCREPIRSLLLSKYYCKVTFYATRCLSFVFTENLCFITLYSVNAKSTLLTLSESISNPRAGTFRNLVTSRFSCSCDNTVCPLIFNGLSKSQFNLLGRQ